MAFRRLASLLAAKKTTHPTMREVTLIQEVGELWRSSALPLFQKNVRKHLEQNASIAGFHKGVVTIVVSDGMAASALQMKKSALIGALSVKKENPVTDLRIQIRSR